MSIVSLQHFQTENHDVPGELAYVATIMCYLALQNYSISGSMLYNCNLHLTMLMVLFFSQRIWFVLWRASQFSDGHALRFAVHIVLFLVFVDSFYCALHLVLKESFTGTLYLAAPLTASILFHHVYLKIHTNVFTAELFNMLSRCVYHSFETWYCITVLPLRFLEADYVYYDPTRSFILTTYVTAHSFVMLLCLELNCLGSEVLQQTRMLGDWHLISDIAAVQSISPKPIEWSYHNCPYPRGSVVLCKGNYYEAVAMLNTSDPSCLPYMQSALVFLFADPERTRALVLASILALNVGLLPFIVWSNHWSMYAMMLIPICAQFLYVRCGRCHAFFTPASLNLAQLQWDLSAGMSQCRLNSGLGPLNCQSPFAYDPWGHNSDDAMDNNYDDGHFDEDRSNGSSIMNPFADVLGGGSVGGQLQYPLFMSAVSASTMFFFGNAGLTGQDGNMHRDM